jgi:hypothetical protein
MPNSMGLGESEGEQPANLKSSASIRVPLFFSGPRPIYLIKTLHSRLYSSHRLSYAGYLPEG